MAERSQVQWGTTTIPYGIRRSARRGTVAVTIEPEGAVVLTAPADTPVVRLDRVVRQKARWIVERLRAVEDQPPALAPREFVSGETFFYLGRQHRLRVVRDAREGVVLEEGRLVVRVARGGGPERVRELLVHWYRTRAALRLLGVVMRLAERVGAQPREVIVANPAKRWGSCTKNGTVRINWRVVQAPMRLIEYVVAHELVHLVHPDHTSEFWAALGRVMPDYEGRRERLRRVGARYVW